MTTFPSVSIVIPAFNEEEVIEQCLKACLNQTVLAKEIIVVNNKSTDSTVALANAVFKEWRENNPVAKTEVAIIDQNELQGITPTRNAGFNSVTADIIGRIDADSIIRPDWVQKVTDHFALNPDDDSITGPVTYYDMPFRRASLAGDRRVRKIVMQLSGEFKPLFGTNMALRKSAWESVKGECCLDLENQMHEDVDLGVHLVQNGFKISYVEKMVAAMSARRAKDSASDFKKYQHRTTETFLRHGVDAPTAKLVTFAFMAIYYPVHFAQPFYSSRFVSKKEEYIETFWDEFGKMSPLSKRLQNQITSNLQTAKTTLETISEKISTKDNK